MAHSPLARRLQRLIAAGRRHGVRHVLEVFRQERIRRTYARSPVPASTGADLIRSFAGVASSADEAAALLLRRCAELVPVADAQLADPAGVRAALLSASSGERIRGDADLIANGRFPALGICIAESSGRFDWHRDYGSGKVWPAEPFHRIRYLDGDGADVKYVWELSRMYWIGWLGKAFMAAESEDERQNCADRFRRLLDDWIEKNPTNVGVNWTVAMEVGIRAFWLAAGIAVFGRAGTLDTPAALRYLALLRDHALFIEHNLEYFPNLTNHYIANCFGLLVAGCVFRDSDEGKRWFAEGRDRLETELRRQTTPDGVNYERSICYHGLVLEMYLIAAVAAERGGNPFGDASKRLIERMAEFTADYTPPAGIDGAASIPQLGDSDDGAILRLRSDLNLYDHRRILALAGKIFGRNDFSAIAGREGIEDLLFLFGPSSLPAAASLSPLPPARSSRVYMPGGFASLRNRHLFAFADIGPIGLHGNNDTLSFTLHSADGTLWIADPGTGCYTRNEELRNALRSTAAHNAPCLDGAEIAEFAGLWRVLDDQTEVRIIESNIDGATERKNKKKEQKEGDEEPIILTAEHHAYRKLPDGTAAVVRRSWSLCGPELKVRDRIEGTGAHEVATRFTVPPGITVVRLDDTTAELRRAGADPDSPRLHFGSSLPIRITEGFYSPGYGLILPAVRIEILPHSSLPAEIAYFCRLVSRAHE